MKTKKKNVLYYITKNIENPEYKPIDLTKELNLKFLDFWTFNHSIVKQVDIYEWVPIISEPTYFENECAITNHKLGKTIQVPEGRNRLVKGELNE